MFFKKRKRGMGKVKERSNIIQYDDMGYPLQLVIMEDGHQHWVDVGVEYAKAGVESGKLHVLEWMLPWEGV